MRSLCCVQLADWPEPGTVGSVNLVDPLPLDLVIDLVNEHSATARQVGGPTDTPPLDELVRMHQIRIARPPESADLEAWAERLHRVFADSDVEGRVNALNDALSLIRPTPMLTTNGIAWSHSGECHDLIAAMVLALVEHARTDSRLTRLGTCSAHHCVDAYLDTTQAGSRRYCSTRCQNRAKTATRRRRLRANRTLKS